MSHLTTGGRRVIAAASLLGLLATGAACGARTDTVKDLGSDLSGATGQQTQQDRSERSLDADARRAAHGQLPAPSPAPAGKRVPDYRP